MLDATKTDAFVERAVLPGAARWDASGSTIVAVGGTTIWIAEWGYASVAASDVVSPSTHVGALPTSAPSAASARIKNTCLLRANPTLLDRHYGCILPERPRTYEGVLEAAAGGPYRGVRRLRLGQAREAGWQQRVTRWLIPVGLRWPELAVKDEGGVEFRHAPHGCEPVHIWNVAGISVLACRGTSTTPIFTAIRGEHEWVDEASLPREQIVEHHCGGRRYLAGRPRLQQRRLPGCRARSARAR
jgi:hypothetical protein